MGIGYPVNGIPHWPGLQEPLKQGSHRRRNLASHCCPKVDGGVETWLGQVEAGWSRSRTRTGALRMDPLSGTVCRYIVRALKQPGKGS